MLKLHPALRLGLTAAGSLFALGLILAGLVWPENTETAWQILKRFTILAVGIGGSAVIARGMQRTDEQGKPIGKDWASLGGLLGMLLAGYITEHRLSASAAMSAIEPGEVIEIAGPTLQGNDFTLDQYRGKVVLIDFWATWCGPCINELPNLKETYRRYHDQGFEIISVSLDHNRRVLEEVVKLEQIVWPQIFSDDPNQQVYDNPNAVRYGISGIPAMLLVDQQGRLIARDLRGYEVPQAVGQALGIPPTFFERLGAVPWMLMNWLVLGTMSSRWFVLVGLMVGLSAIIAVGQRVVMRTSSFNPQPQARTSK